MGDDLKAAMASAVVKWYRPLPARLSVYELISTD
jgi:hypothetical protein